MHTTHDASHATNVANFAALINYCQNTVAARYNPSLTKHKLVNLNQRLSAAQNLLEDLDEALRTSSESIRERKEAFDSLDSLASRAVNNFLICDVTHGQKTAIKSILKKIQGKRITAKQAPEPATEPVTTVEHTATQQTYVDKVQHLHNLILMLQVATDYDPNEPDLKLSAINDFYEGLKDFNEEVMEKGSLLDKMRIDRNRCLYRDGDGIVKLAKEVKLYVESACGNNSVESKYVKAIPFKDYGHDEPVPFVTSSPA